MLAVQHNKRKDSKNVAILNNSVKNLTGFPKANQPQSATQPAQHTAQPAAEKLTLQRAKEILSALESVGINPASNQPHTSINLPAKELQTIFAYFSQRSKVTAGTVYKYFLDFAATDESEKYFYKRLKQAFPNLSAAELLAAAAMHGITPSRKGIAINPRNFDGTPFLYEVTKDGRTSQHTYQIIRNTPLLTKYKPKYLAPSKLLTGVQGVPPQPNNVVIENLKNGIKNDTLFLTEGYFKALFLSLCGVPCVAFNGIKMFNLTDEIKDYLTELEVKNICILFDNDATNLGSAKDTNRTDNGRLNDFYSAVTRIAAQIFKDAELKKIKVFYCEVNKTDATKDEKGEYLKAFDDLMIHDRTKQNEITTALESLKNSDYFKFLRLHKSNYTEKLQTWFSCDNYRNFYNKYIKPQGKTDFSFDGVQYVFKNGVPYLSKHPFLVAYDSQKLTVNQYVSEAITTIANTVKTAQLSAISAPMSSGKTTASIEIGRALNRQIVLCVPLRSIASQQWNDLKISENSKNRNVALMQGGEITDRHGIKITAKEASKKEIIVCTYDMLESVRNLQERILFVDEAHELLDAYGYRYDTLLTLYTLLKSSYKSVLLSGTMPTHVVKLLGASFIEIVPKILQNKVFEIYETSELIASFLHQLKIKKQNNGVDVVLINDTEKAKELQKMLIDCGDYQPNEIAVLSRSVIDSEGSEVYEKLLTANELQGVKLVFATIVIKQGVNVNNQLYQPKNLFDALETATLPISTVYTVGINDANELLQFSARFRKMKTVFIKAFLEKERNIKPAFLYDTETYAAEKIKTSKNFAALENSQPNQTARTSNFTHSLDSNFFYNSKSECYESDILKILYMEKQRKIKYGNNAALFTELAAAQNTTVVFASDTTEPAAELVTDVKQKLQKSAAEKKTAAENSRTEFLTLCENGQERLVIDNLYLKAKEYRKKQPIQFFETLYYTPQGIEPPAENSTELTEFYELQKEAFANGYFTKIAKYLVRLKFWQCDDILNVLRNNTDNDLKLICERFNAFTKGKRPQKLGVKLLQKAIIEKHGTQTVLSFGEFEFLARRVFSNDNLKFTPSEIRHLFERHFYAAKITKFSFINFAPITATPQKDGLKITIGNEVFLLQNAVYCEF